MPTLLYFEKSFENNNLLFFDLEQEGPRGQLFDKIVNFLQVLSDIDLDYARVSRFSTSICRCDSATGARLFPGRVRLRIDSSGCPRVR